MTEFQAEAEATRATNRAVLLATALVVLAGAFHAIVGLAAVGDKEFFEAQAPDHYYYNWNPEFWGWINIIGGIALIVSGVFLFRRRAWAAYLTIALAGLNAVWTFFLVFLFPLWAIVCIALDVLVIWASLREDVIDEWE
jgi:cytochrome b subunit of formate dehydrogenase